MKIKLRMGDWIILGCCLCLVPLSWSLTSQHSGEPTAIAITVDDSIPLVYPINSNREINVSSKLGDSIIEIKDSRVRFLRSPCHGKICMLSGWHEFSGDQIACLPNRVSVSLMSEQERFDGINF